MAKRDADGGAGNEQVLMGDMNYGRKWGARS